MTEYLIDSPDKFIELAKETKLKDRDIEMLRTFCKAQKTACCSGPRNAASKGIEAIYKKIIFTKLEDIKNELLEVARKEGCDAIRFKGSFRVNRREMDEYDKLIV